MKKWHLLLITIISLAIYSALNLPLSYRRLGELHYYYIGSLSLLLVLTTPYNHGSNLKIWTLWAIISPLIGSFFGYLIFTGVNSVHNNRTKSIEGAIDFLVAGTLSPYFLLHLWLISTLLIMFHCIIQFILNLKNK